MTYKCINNMHTKQHYMHLELAFLPSKQLHNYIYTCKNVHNNTICAWSWLFIPHLHQLHKHIHSHITHTSTQIYTRQLYMYLGVGFLCQFDINQWLFSLTPLTTIHRLHMHTSSQMYTHPHKCTHISSISQFDINQTHIRIKCT